jgi:putative ABC transport system permease protein
MTLAELVPKNLLRHKTRTLLTLLGISIGIATILALGAVADGLKEAFTGVVTAGEGDFIVTQYGASDMIVSRIDEEAETEIAAVSGVKSVAGASFAVTRYGQNPYFFLFGTTPEGIEMGGFALVNGRMPTTAGEVALGKLTSGSIGLGTGDTIDLLGRSLDIVGVFETGEQMQDSAALLTLEALQEKTDTPGQLTMLLVDAADGADITELTARIDAQFEGELVTIKNADEMSRVDQGAEVISAASWLISALAIVIGGIGVMNTMIVSVFDRTREIGVLKAIGWRRRTVLAMILGEAVIIGLVAVVVGSGIAMLILVPLSNYDVVSSFMSPAYSVGLWGQAVVVAMLVAVLGGLYPAWHAANLSPVEALRHE